MSSEDRRFPLRPTGLAREPAADAAQNTGVKHRLSNVTPSMPENTAVARA